MAQSARTLGLKVLDGPLMGLELTTWSEVRGSAEAVHICSWILPGGPQHPKDSALVATLGCQSPSMSMAMDFWRTIQDWIPASNVEEVTTFL